MGHYANFKAYEESLNGTKTIHFPWNAYKVILMNDSSSKDLVFEISGERGTLRPTETFAASVRLKGITLVANEVSYRLWIYG